MKIDGIEGIFQVKDSEKNKNGVENPDRGFQKILKQTLKPQEPAATPPTATTFVHQTLPVVKSASIPSDPADVIAKVENLLDILDNYRRLLAEPDNSLRTIEELVEELEGQQLALSPLVNELPEGDELKAILNQSLVTASVEIFKFHRGDYLAA